MFEMTQPNARMPVPHYHGSRDEIIYGLCSKAGRIDQRPCNRQRASSVSGITGKSRAKSAKLRDGHTSPDLRNLVSSEKLMRIENISLLQKREQGYTSTHPVPFRGASAIVTNEGRVAVEVE